MHRRRPHRHFSGAAARDARAVRAALGLAVLLAAAACTPMATYPPVDGAVSIANPSVPPLPELMADAIIEIDGRAARPDSGGLVFNLPPGTSAGVYRNVRRRLPEDARPMMAADAGTVRDVIHVDQIRLRGTDAEVDVVHRRSPDGPPQLTTVRMKQRVPGGWRVDSVRTWLVERTEPTPTFPEPDVRTAGVPDDAAGDG